MRPTILNPLFAPVSKLDGIGPKLEKTLTKLIRGSENASVTTVGDLLFHLPSGVIDRRLQPEIATAPEGVIGTIKVRVDRHNPPPRGNNRVPYRVFVHDESGELALVWFRGQSNWLEKLLPVGETRYVSGKIEWFNGRPNMVHPDHVVSEADFSSLPLVEPVYPSTAGLSAKVMTKSIKAALHALPDLEEWLDPTIVDRQGWQDLRKSLLRVHEPRDSLDIDPQSPAWARLAYDEILTGQLALALVRNNMKKSAGLARQASGIISRIVLDALPFSLTNSQTEALSEISADLANPDRMLRLLQGDVGSGKTVVALLAMAHVVESGAQAALMAPTEILARQHLATIEPLCQAAGLSFAVLTGREKGKERDAIYDALASGETDIVVGTHALFQDAVKFKNLGLGIIDEQHRFGVHQRLALSAKGPATDILVMTATPIPRTLVLTFFGDMDVSQLREKPAGRQPIQTTALPLERLDELVARIEGALAKGEKAYWICPLVEESDELPVTAAEDRFQFLSQRLNTPVGLVHGRMKAAEKDDVMRRFKDGEVRLLVATTVVEVGVDVPDATIMVIEHAERFGLAQLHQLRGRVGRGDKPSTCLLLYKSPLGEVAQARLNIMRQTEDGFLIAEEDLKLRGEGEVLGVRQSGSPGFRVARMEVHGELLEMARDEARLIVATNPGLSEKRGDALRTALYLHGKDEAVRLLRAG
ncbi:MAG: ATP-dependent DNA helicase RecG [Pseudomonadota bacterium]